jgi:hypothetical protein
MTVTPQAPTPDPYEEPGTEVPETEPDVPQGPQETNPDADETGDDAAAGQMPETTNTEVGA